MIMNLQRLIAPSVLALAASAAFADDKEDWQKRLDVYTTAFKKKDTKAMAAWAKANCDPTFKFIPLKAGPLGLDDWIKQESAMATAAEKTTVYEMHVDVAKATNVYANAMTTNHFAAMTKMDGKVGLYKYDFSAVVQSSIKNGKRVITFLHIISGKKTFNGKTLPK